MSREEGSGTIGGQPPPGEPETPAPPPEASPPSEALPPRHDENPDGGGRDGTREAATAIGTLSTVPGRRRPARYGLLVQFESRPGDPELGRLVDNTIWINEAHPAYMRAIASRSTGYHIALSVALALAPFASEATSEHAFITRFLAHWGGASASKPGNRGRRRKRR